MKIIVEATPKEIAALVLELQERQGQGNHSEEIKRIREHIQTIENVLKIRTDKEYRESILVREEGYTLCANSTQELVEDE